MVQKNFLYILKPPVMKKSFLKKIVPHIPAAIAITCLIIYGSFRQTEDKPSPEVAAKQCCSGYTVPMPNLKQFMLDSLQGIQFEGGVYNKASLIAAINATPGTSVYLLNLLPNCNISKGTDLAITSPAATGVAFVRGLCNPCPGLSCCPNYACVARINRTCINYLAYPLSQAQTQIQPGNSPNMEQ